MSNKYNLDRETYRAIKKMDRVLKAAIGQIKGIGENRLNEIMDVIQSFVDNAEKKED